MAINKTIEFDNGVIATYHKISIINNRRNPLSVTIDSYSSEKYRNIEKRYYDIMDNFDALIAEKEAILEKEELIEEEKNRLNEIEDTINWYINQNISSYIVKSFELSINIPIESAVFSAIYDEIKKLDMFIGASDC